MQTRLSVLIVNILAGIVVNVNKFDFGLFENEPLLIDLHREDLELTDSIAEANGQFNNKEISEYLDKERVSPEVSDISHPVNAYHLIKKHTLAFNDLLLRLEVEVKERLEDLRNRTELIRTLQDDDLKRSRNALAVIIHSYDMDLDTFARGEIEANRFGNGASTLQASRGLSANDLGNIAISAIEYGFLGTASVILKAALSRARQGEHLENRFRRIVKDTEKLHNSYLERHRSIYTDSYSLKPFLIDEDMQRRRKQPKFIKTGSHTDLRQMEDSLAKDGSQYARTSFMLQSCGGFRETVPALPSTSPSSSS